ncbi:NAM-associated domain-containing protein [Heracleum sosnowskyi]|uniref:NAM-associated domain-containing protein n=1 Tax=Heracleum sosnowskyi TaxID=360622 RepID=A0AAD8MTZ9_9APIA|nr:NAM-associated domain-containing protein [Heracleum sosnowskyi]
MAARHRSTSYSHEEDKHLCHVYLDISQNPIIGINQSRDQFWSHIEIEYNNSKPITVTQDRPKKSLQCRMQIILSAIGKLRGCVQQIENQNPSSASQKDILTRAKVLLEQDKKYDKGFKFDHVWDILKDTEKFGDDHSNVTPYHQTQTSNFVSSQANSPSTESPTSASPGLSAFSPNINYTSVDGCSNQRPIGVKKAKGKRKVDDQTSVIVDTILEEQRQRRSQHDQTSQHGTDDLPEF